MESISECQRFVFHFIHEWAHLVSIHFKKKPFLIWQFWSGAYICADNLTSWIMFRTILWNRLDAYISCGSACHLSCNGKIRYLFQCQIHLLNLHFHVILSGEWKGIIKSWSIRKTFWTKVHIILIFTVQAHPLAGQSWIHLMKWLNYRGKLGRYQWWGCYISLVNFSVQEFFDIIKVPVTLSEPHSQLAGVTAACLRRRLYDIQ